MCPSGFESPIDCISGRDFGLGNTTTPSNRSAPFGWMGRAGGVERAEGLDRAEGVEQLVSCRTVGAVAVVDPMTFLYTGMPAAWSQGPRPPIVLLRGTNLCNGCFSAISNPKIRTDHAMLGNKQLFLGFRPLKMIDCYNCYVIKATKWKKKNLKNIVTSLLMNTGKLRRRYLRE